MSDTVNRPPHYAVMVPEPITVIEGWNLGYRLGNCVKYIARHKNKGAAIEDLRKARWYLDREIAALEAVDKATAAALPVVHDDAKCLPGPHTHSWNVPLSVPRE